MRLQLSPGRHDYNLNKSYCVNQSSAVSLAFGRCPEVIVLAITVGLQSDQKWWSWREWFPRLVAFSFTLALPYRDTQAGYHALILRFHTDVWQCIREYSRQRQQARQHSPPTVLRWLWEMASAPECRMVILMNLDTLGTVRNPQRIDSLLHEMSALIGDAW